MPRKRVRLVGYLSRHFHMRVCKASKLSRSNLTISSFILVITSHIHRDLLGGLAIVNMCSHKIWSDVDELAFHENAILLEALARSQAKQPHTERRNHSDLAWARDFLDDFALIAAGPGEASNVAAACLELSQDREDSITIRVAKNEDFDFGGRQRLAQVVEVMNQVRQRGTLHERLLIFEMD